MLQGALTFLTVSTHKKVAGDGSETDRRLLLKSPWIEKITVHDIARVSERDTAAAALRHRHATKNTFVAAARNPNWQVRYDVANHKNMPVEAARILSDDEDVRVWGALLENEVCPHGLHERVLQRHQENV